MRRIILICVLLAACQTKQNSAETSPKSNLVSNTVNLSEAQYKQAGIQLDTITHRFLSTNLKLTGKVMASPQSMRTISAPLGGYVKYSKLLPGMPVSAGEVLVVLEDMQFIQLQQDYLTAKAQLELSESEYHRQKKLNENKTSSDKVFEQAQANYRTQLILVKSLGEKLKLLGLEPLQINPETISKSISIHSPIMGYVSSVYVNTGKYVSPTEVMFELTNPAQTHITLNALEKDVPYLVIGQKVWVYSNTQPEKKYHCTISLINPNVSGNGVSEVICTIEEPFKQAFIGMFVNAEIETQSYQANVLPQEAVVRFDNQTYIFVQKNNQTYEMIAVEVGNTDHGWIELKKYTPLLGKNIVTQGAYSLLMMLKNTGEE